MFASESVPSLNKYFQLVAFPDEAFRDFILKILVADVVTCFCFDRLMKLIFCPKILFASVEGTTMKDVFGLGKTIAVILFIMNMFLGNNDQWDEMIAEEERLEALANATDDGEGGILGAVDGEAEVCVGDACNATDATGMGDEF